MDIIDRNHVCHFDLKVRRHFYNVTSTDDNQMSNTNHVSRRFFRFRFVLCVVMVIGVHAVAQTQDGFKFPIGNGDPTATGTGYNPNSNGWLADDKCSNQTKKAIHPGEDWNSNFGGISDRDDPVLAAGGGLVEYANYSGPKWGNVVVIRHDAPPGANFALPDGTTVGRVWSLYAHMSSIALNPLTQLPWALTNPIERGQQIGTFGGLLSNTKGTWSENNYHLHFEIRKTGLDQLDVTAFPCPRDINDSKDVKWVTDRYIEPSAFIRLNPAQSSSTVGFWHVLDVFRSPKNIYAQDKLDIAVLSPAINPTLITLPSGDDGKLPHSVCGSVMTCISPSTGIWWFGVNNHSHRVGGALHGTYIDWIFSESSNQVPRTGGTSVVPNLGKLAFEFDLTGLTGPVLQFLTWWEVESADADRFDLMQVLLRDQNGIEHHLKTLNPANDVNGPPDVPYTSAGFGISPFWVEERMNLSQFSNQKVKIVFSFDTRDVLYNGFRGWLIDSPRIIPTTGQPAALKFRAPSLSYPELPRDLARPRD